MEENICEIRAIRGYNRSCFTRNSLSITGLQVALLLNFKESRLQWKRVVNERRRNTADHADHADGSEGNPWDP